MSEDLVQTPSPQGQALSGHPLPEGSELCDPLDALTWKLVHAFGATVSTEQWLAARELLVQFQPKGEVIDLAAAFEPVESLSGHHGCNVCGAPLHMGCCNPLMSSEAKTANALRINAGGAASLPERGAAVTEPLPQHPFEPSLSAPTLPVDGSKAPEAIIPHPRAANPLTGH